MLIELKSVFALIRQLLYAHERYDTEDELQAINSMIDLSGRKLGQASTVDQLRTVEGRVALRYWEVFKKALPEWLDFQGRLT